MKNKEIFELEELALGGNSEAAEELVRRYSEGIGVPKDLDIANTWSEYVIEKEGFTEEEVDSLLDENDEYIEKDETSTEREDDSWLKKKMEYESDETFELRQKTVSGDQFAKIIIGERYLNAKTISERTEGAELLEDAAANIRELIVNCGSNQEAYKDALTEILYKLGGYYASVDNESKTFECYSNIYELTDEIPMELISCYALGIGTPRDTVKEDELLMKRALRGGIVEKTAYADDCLESGAKIKAREWYEAALHAEDASQHEAICNYINAKVNMNADEAIEKIEKMAESNDAEACCYLDKLRNSNTDEEENKSKKRTAIKQMNNETTETLSKELKALSATSFWLDLVLWDALIIVLMTIASVLLVSGVAVAVGILSIIIIDAIFYYRSKKSDKPVMPKHKFAIVAVAAIVIVGIGSYLLAPANSAMRAISNQDADLAKRIIAGKVENHSIQESIFNSKLDSYVESIKDDYKNNKLTDAQVKSKLNAVYNAVGSKLGKNLKAYVDSIDAYKQGEDYYKNKKWIEAIGLLTKVVEDFPKYADAQKKIEESKNNYKNEIFEKAGEPSTVAECVTAIELLSEAETALKDDPDILDKIDEISVKYISLLDTAVDKWLANYDYDKANSAVSKACELLGKRNELKDIDKKVQDAKPLEIAKSDVINSNDLYMPQDINFNEIKDNYGNIRDIEETMMIVADGEDGGYGKFNLKKKRKRLKGTIVCKDDVAEKFLGTAIIQDETGKILYKRKISRDTKPLNVNISLNDAKIITLKCVERKESSTWGYGRSILFTGFKAY